MTFFTIVEVAVGLWLIAVCSIPLLLYYLFATEFIGERKIDGSLPVAGTMLLVAANLLSNPPFVSAAGGLSIGAGIVVFGLNILLVVHRHSPHGLDQVLLGSLTPRQPTVAEEFSEP